MMRARGFYVASLLAIMSSISGTNSLERNGIRG